MPNWLPWALLCFVAVLLAVMPWRRPHPNHEFMLHVLELLEDEDAKVLVGRAPAVSCRSSSRVSLTLSDGARLMVFVMRARLAHRWPLAVHPLQASSPAFGLAGISR